MSGDANFWKKTVLQIHVFAKITRKKCVKSFCLNEVGFQKCEDLEFVFA